MLLFTLGKRASSSDVGVDSLSSLIDTVLSPKTVYRIYEAVNSSTRAVVEQEHTDFAILWTVNDSRDLVLRMRCLSPATKQNKMNRKTFGSNGTLLFSCR